MTKNRKPQPVNKTGPAEDIFRSDVDSFDPDFQEIVGDDIAETPELEHPVADLDEKKPEPAPEKPLVYIMRKNPQTGEVERILEK